MRFQFDPTKAASNLKKHGVSFADAEGVFADPLAAHRTDPDSEGEERFIALGLGNAGQMLVATRYEVMRFAPFPRDVPLVER